MVRSSSLGVFQSDIIIRTGIKAALDDIRANPWLLDFTFQSLLSDSLTRSYYGEDELRMAKDWFINTDIPIKMAYQIDHIRSPIIAITLADSSEAESTLGDIHYESHEDIDPIEIMVVKPIAGPFTPVSYNSQTGIMVLPSGVSTASIFPGQYVKDNVNGKTYVIETVTEDGVGIAANTQANFTKATIEATSPYYVASLESISYRESFKIEIFVPANHTQLLYLHSVLIFALNRYKQKYFEARGFERSTISSQTLGLFSSDPEIIFTRGVVLTGYVRQYWPKDIVPKIDGVSVSPQIIPDFGGIKILGQKAPESETENETAQGWSVIDDE